MTTNRRPTPPSPAEPRQPWEVMREAAQIAENSGWRPVITQSMRMLAAKLEAAAVPGLPTLAEAVRAYSQKLDSGASEVGAEYATMMEALSRAEAGQ